MGEGVGCHLCAQGRGPLEIHLVQQRGCYQLAGAVSVKERGPYSDMYKAKEAKAPFSLRIMIFSPNSMVS